MKPTVGQTVLYYPKVDDPGGIVPGGPFAAIVAWVWDDARRVNLLVIESEGGTFGRTNVELRKPDSVCDSGCWDWPQRSI